MKSSSPPGSDSVRFPPTGLPPPPKAKAPLLLCQSAVPAHPYYLTPFRLFVIFLRMFEAPSATSRSPLDLPDLEHDRKSVDRIDTKQRSEIAQRNKTNRLTSRHGCSVRFFPFVFALPCSPCDLDQTIHHSTRDSFTQDYIVPLVLQSWST